MQNEITHKLEVEKHHFGPGYLGYCETCTDPDWIDDGWDGQVWFEGMTQQEVIDLHHDHVLEESA